MPMNCALANHELRNGCLVTNPEHIKFIKKSVIDFRPLTEICHSCKVTMEFMYETKMRRAILKKKLERESRIKLNSVSSVRSSTNSSSSRNSSIDLVGPNDTIDQLVSEVPRHQSFNNKQRENSISLTSSQDSVLSQTVIPSMTPKRTRPEAVTAARHELESHTPKMTAYRLANLSQDDIVFTPTIYGTMEVNNIVGEIEVETTHTQQPSTNGFGHAKRAGESRILANSHTNITNAEINPKASNTTDIRKFFTKVISPKSNAARIPPSTFRLSQEHSTNSAAVSIRPNPSNGNNVSHQVAQSTPSHIRLSQEPTTSAATNVATPRGQSATSAAGRRVFSRPSNVFDDASESMVDDDDEPLYSLNAFNGTRMPNVQPIIKRSKQSFSHPNPDVMDIYLRGTTGG